MTAMRKTVDYDGFQYQISSIEVKTRVSPASVSGESPYKIMKALFLEFHYYDILTILGKECTGCRILKMKTSCYLIWSQFGRFHSGYLS